MTEATVWPTFTPHRACQLCDRGRDGKCARPEVLAEIEAQPAKLRQGEALQPLSYHELWASDDLMAVNAEVGFRMQDIIKIARAIERLITERMSAGGSTC